MRMSMRAASSATMTVVAALLAATPVLARTAFVYVDANGVGITSGEPEEVASLRAKFDQPFFWLSRDGKAYVATDPRALTRVEEALRPLRERSSEQGVVGARQAAIGIQQATIGLEQASLGLGQAGGSAEPGKGEDAAAAQRHADAKKRQQELAARQEALAKEQKELAARQSALAEGTKERQAKLEETLAGLVQDLVRQGLAREVARGSR